MRNLPYLVLIAVFGFHTTASSQESLEWSVPSAVNSNSGINYFSRQDESHFTFATDDMGNGVAVWKVGNTGQRLVRYLYSRYSFDTDSWSESAPLYEHEDAVSYIVGGADIAVDANGRWVLVWSSQDTFEDTVGVDADVYYSVYDFDADTWAFPAMVSQPDNVLHTDIEPKIAFDSQGNWIVIWLSSNNLLGTINTGFNVHCRRFDTTNESWSPITYVNSSAPVGVDGPNPNYDSPPSIVSNESGKCIAVWQVYYPTLNLYYSIYDEDNETWSIQKEIQSSARPQTDPKIVFNGTDGAMLAWSSDVEGDPFYPRVMYANYEFATDTWSDPARLNSNSDLRFFSEETEPYIATDGLGNWYAAWSTINRAPGITEIYNDVLFATYTVGDASWSMPSLIRNVDPDVFRSDFTPYVTTDRIGNLMVTWITNPEEGSLEFADYVLVYSRILGTGLTPENSPTGSGGCFIATAAYGTPLADEIGVLRTFRDTHLLSNGPGTALVETYYRVSPPIADLAAQHPAFAHLIRIALAPVILIFAMDSGGAMLILLGIGLVYMTHQFRKRRLRLTS